jgi:hypothetical protein
MAAVSAGRRRRAASLDGEPQPRLTREEIVLTLATNREMLLWALDRTPIVPPASFWPDTGVITRAEAAIMRHAAARYGLNIDFIPLTSRIRSPHGGAA